MDRDLNNDEFRRYHDLIHQLTGIHYPIEKLPLLSNRLRRRLRAVSLSDYLTYLAFLGQASNRNELHRFIDSITTNETYFFRCRRHWDLFADWVRDTDTERKGRPLRIWSAACSSGCEAFTALIVLEQLFGRDFGGRTVEVLGTDLNEVVLAEARQAIYRPYALAQAPPDIGATFFRALPDERLELNRRFLRHVTFRRHNLMEPIQDRPFDFVFLRNVMIYFDTPSKMRVLGHVEKALRPGGMLLVGESESLLNVQHGFTYLRPSWFQRPANGAPPAAPRPSAQRSPAAPAGPGRRP